MRSYVLKPMDVKAVPESLEPGVLYISSYGTVVHLCCCGCGNEIVTPIGPTDWRLTRTGGDVSLRPSVGNWHLPCRSHYFITKNNVEWAPQWSDAQIAAARAFERHEKQEYYAPKPQAEYFWSRFWKWLRGLFS